MLFFSREEKKTVLLDDRGVPLYYCITASPPCCRPLKKQSERSSSSHIPLCAGRCAPFGIPAPTLTASVPATAFPSTQSSAAANAIFFRRPHHLIQSLPLCSSRRFPLSPSRSPPPSCLPRRHRVAIALAALDSWPCRFPAVKAVKSSCEISDRTGSYSFLQFHSKYEPRTSGEVHRRDGG